MHSKKLIVIAGPTAVGKTEVALRLAEHFKTEIISADSRQIYRELEVGTAKPSADELNRVPHHFINTHSIDQSYDAGAYGRDALTLIHSLFKTHDTLILCGGSGLYVKAVLEGFDDMPEIDAPIRKQILSEYEAKGLAWLQQRVNECDPDYYEQVDRNNPHRLIRALELFRGSGLKASQLRVQEKRSHDFRIIKIGLEVEREILYKRIETRMDVMIRNGLFEEAEHFFSKRELNALQTVGYKEIFDYLEGKYDRVEAIRLLKRNSRRYAKRQLTWFKRDPEMSWLRPDQVNGMIELIGN